MDSVAELDGQPAASVCSESLPPALNKHLLSAYCVRHSAAFPFGLPVSIIGYLLSSLIFSLHFKNAPLGAVKGECKPGVRHRGACPGLAAGQEGSDQGAAPR